MTPYDNILTKIGFFHDQSGQNKLSKRYGDDVIDTLSRGNSVGPAFLHFQGDQKTANVVGDALKRSATPRSESFVKILHNAVFKTFDKPGSTPVIGVPTPPVPVFDTSSSAALISLNPVFAQLPVPQLGGEAAWVAALAPLLGAVAPVPPPIMQVAGILGGLGIVITPPIQPAVPVYSINTLQGFEFMNSRPPVPQFEFGTLLDELVTIPYSVLAQFSMPTLALVHNPSLLKSQIYQTCLNSLAKSSTFMALVSKPVKPTVLLSSIVVWCMNISTVIAVVVIGSTIGVGNVAKNAALILGAI